MAGWLSGLFGKRKDKRENHRKDGGDTVVLMGATASDGKKSGQPDIDGKSPDSQTSPDHGGDSGGDDGSGD